jgi:hypothetical protein
VKLLYSDKTRNDYFHSQNFSENLPEESMSISNNPIKLSRNDRLPRQATDWFSTVVSIQQNLLSRSHSRKLLLYSAIVVVNIVVINLLLIIFFCWWGVKGAQATALEVSTEWIILFRLKLKFLKVSVIMALLVAVFSWSSCPSNLFFLLSCRFQILQSYTP